jgi:hypothetical protein
VLAELARWELVPAIWLPDPSIRAERERARFRPYLVRYRTSPRTGSTPRSSPLARRLPRQPIGLVWALIWAVNPPTDPTGAKQSTLPSTPRPTGPTRNRYRPPESLRVPPDVNASLRAQDRCRAGDKRPTQAQPASCRSGSADTDLTDIGWLRDGENHERECYQRASKDSEPPDRRGDRRDLLGRPFRRSWLRGWPVSVCSTRFELNLPDRVTRVGSEACSRPA